MWCSLLIISMIYCHAADHRKKSVVTRNDWGRSNHHRWSSPLSSSMSQQQRKRQTYYGTKPIGIHSKYYPNRQQHSLRFEHANTNNSHDEQCRKDVVTNPAYRLNQLRAGGSRSSYNNIPFDKIDRAFTMTEQILRLMLQCITKLGIIILPPTFITFHRLICFYQRLPHDAIMAQAGLVYCFAGGYFPTLFAAIAAAQQSGMNIMLSALNDLYAESTKAIQVAIEVHNNQDGDDTYYHDLNDTKSSFWGSSSSDPNSSKNRKSYKDMTFHEKCIYQTRIVLTTIDPMKINTALGSLYTTWLGISSVLERQFAKTIALSITIADSLEPMTTFLLKPPLKLLIPPDFDKWIPLFIQWSCKAVAMSFAWKIQRILTASSSALVGGLMFSRHLLRMIFANQKNNRKKNQKNKKKSQKHVDDDDLADSNQQSTFDDTTTPVDEIIGLFVAAMGLYVQIGQGFSFQIPFPLNLITWPFSFAENWIQWQITKKPNT